MRRQKGGAGMIIRIFTTPQCARCRAAKEFFADRKLDFEEVNVEGDFGALRKMIRLSGAKSVPVIQMGEQVIVGFERARLEELLAQE
jgi:glutaredoxin 3